jgi:hypothetical protein
MKLNTEMITKLNPCASRFDNFKQHNPEFDSTMVEFLKLDNITYDDKIWVATKLLTKNQLVNWSILCAESVKYLFESKYPNDKCLTELFNYLKSGLDFENLTEVQRTEVIRLRSATYATYAASAADATYAAADAAAAYAAADAAADAAYAAYAAANAAYAATYAATYAAAAAYAAYAAANAAYATTATAAATYAAADAAADAAAAYAADRKEQNNLNLLYLISVIN